MIKKEDVINEICGIRNNEDFNKSKRAINKIYSSIGSCSNCEYFEGMSVSLTNCGRIDAWVREDFFCADFKSKQDD